ncbi:hypothetical protein [Phycicoccus jejuensis]|uniref:hypothetical protein n=1 Tax=Phycicoccus jejuensis TaxID=367299 RepID=UPI00068C7C07|nr:hypothetical protein [Phycicoccus jejuensis]
MGYEVQIEDLRSSAQAARDALDVVEDTKAPDDLRGIAAAIPGASAASLVETVATGWEADVRSWVRGARRYAEGLESAATQYETDDAAARAAFTPAGPNQPR